MKKHPLFRSKTSADSILVVVAHPDDESLWFFGGLSKLSKLHELDILCLTYDRESMRGKEILEATKYLNCSVYFGGLHDSGIDRCLDRVEETIHDFITKQKKHYGILITHPPHGGEKPHPHHIQAFHALRRISKRTNCRFGFFCEKILEMKPLTKHYYCLPWKHDLHLLTSYYKVLSQARLPLIKRIKECFAAISFYLKLPPSAQTFKIEIYYPDYIQKQKALLNYKSQLKYLSEYKTFRSKIEYLYLEPQKAE